MKAPHTCWTRLFSLSDRILCCIQRVCVLDLLSILDEGTGMGWVLLSSSQNALESVQSSTHPIPVPSSSMDRRSNTQTLWMQHSIYQIKKITSFNKCAALSYIMPSLSITLFSLPSATFPQSNIRLGQKLQNRSLRSWTASLLIHMRKSNTVQVRCN